MAIVLACSASKAPCNAAGPAGEYEVVGTNSDGSAYAGHLRIEPMAGAYRLEWEAGGSSVGIGVLLGNHLMVAIGGTQCTIVGYQLSAEGGFEGVWSGTDGKLGRERAIPGVESTRGLAGDYLVSGTNPDNSRYKGALSVEPEAENWRFHWRTGNDYNGRGLLHEGVIAVAVGPQSCGLALYQLGSGGQLRGKWSYAGKPSGSEIARRR